MILKTCLKLSRRTLKKCSYYSGRQCGIRQIYQQDHRVGIPSCLNVIHRGYGSGAGGALPPSASYLRDDAQEKVVLLGTVHFSKQSVEDVSQIVKVLKPNAILIELCRRRIGILELDEKKFLEDARNLDAEKIKVLNPNAILVELCKERVGLLELDEKKFIEAAKKLDAEGIRQATKGQNFASGMLHAMMLKTYADIAKELGVAPGGEFRRAYQEMKKIPGCKLFLGDRPIQITIARAFQSLTVYELGQIMYHLSSATPKPVDKDQLERYKDRDFVQAQFEEIMRDVPAFRKIFHVFVDERDKCLAFSLQECVKTVKKEPRVLAVVGMGHVDGITKYYGKMTQEDIVPLLLLPRPPIYRLVLRKAIKFTLLFLLFTFCYRMLFG